jgi:hypothetical protein
MEEATEICKLRLFLKLVSQVEADPKKPNYGIEPLPDIDFNIRAGNTLVGFATLEEVRNAVNSESSGQGKLLFDDTLERIEKSAVAVDQTFQEFRSLQSVDNADGKVLSAKKVELRSSLGKLNDELDRYLADEYEKGQSKKPAAFQKWKASHQPFHWFVEFYGIVNQGGFDVIIGNPPYVEYKDIRNFYKIIGFLTEDCSNLFAYVLERCSSIGRLKASIGMIIPLSAFSTDRMIPLINLLKHKSSKLKIANFSWRPAKLFDGVNQQLSIVLQVLGDTESQIYSTNYILWESESRIELFSKVQFSTVKDKRLDGSIVKLGASTASSILNKIRLKGKEIGNCFVKKSDNKVFYRRGGLYWKVFVDFETESSEEKIICLTPDINKYSIIAALSSSLWFWYFTATSDCRHLGNRDISTFPFEPREMKTELYEKLNKMGKAYVQDLQENAMSVVRTYKGKNDVDCLSFRVKMSKPIIDEIDRVLAQHYGFTDEELDFIINYDIKYRMGRDDGEEQ